MSDATETKSPSEETTQQVEKKSSEFVMYAAEHAPKFSLRVGETRVQFNNGVLKLDLNDEEEAAIHEELQKLLKKKPHLRQHMRYIDMKAAEQIARRHQQELRQMGGAVSGQAHSENIREAMSRAQLAQRDEELKRQGVTDEQLAQLNKEMSEDGLQLTGKDSGVVRNSDLKIAEKPAQEDVAKDVGDNANKLNNLLGKKNSD